jgi:hypothetical protein
MKTAEVKKYAGARYRKKKEISLDEPQPNSHVSAYFFRKKHAIQKECQPNCK